MLENPYGAPLYAQPAAPAELKHSGVGITSFVLSILSGAGLMILGAVAQANGV